MRSRGLATAAVAALLAALSILALTPVASGAEVLAGSPLAGEPDATKEPTGGDVDTVYWLKTLPDGSSAAMTVAGTVRAVTIKGYAETSGLLQTVLVQVLRPQPDGSLLVVETSQPFTLPTTLGPATYTFEPTNMTVQPGDFIGIATLGGQFRIATDAAGAVTDDFSGHEKDMNGDEVSPTKVEEGVELLVQVKIETNLKIVSEEKPKKEEPPPLKPCKCEQLTVELEPTLVRRRLPSHKHTFGVGFIWQMTCTEGDGGCTGTLVFKPPEIRAGTLPKTRGPKLNLERVTFECETACKTSRTGHIEIKMRSRDQINKLFGRTLAFEIHVYCSGTEFRYLVNVPVTRSGRLRRSTLTLAKGP